MFRTLFVAAFAAVATATTWPMVTVNSAGDIVLNSVTRASSFQLTTSTVTAAPTSGTAASVSTVTALDSSIDTFIVSIPTTLAASGGFKLPTPTVGRTITLFNDGTNAGAFTVWTSATSVFFDSSTSVYQFSVTADMTRVTFTATDTTNWAVSTSSPTTAVTAAGIATITTASTISASTTTSLTAANIINGIYTVSTNSGFTVTLNLPAVADIETALGTSAQVGSTFSFRVANTAAAQAASDIGVTLSANSITSYTTIGNLLVPPESSRVFDFVRTAASTYTVYARRLDLGAITQVSVTATGGSATAETATCHALSCKFIGSTATTAATVGVTLAAEAQTWTISNNYRSVGDSITLENTGGGVYGDVDCVLGQVPATAVDTAADKIYVTCRGVTTSNAIITMNVGLSPY